MPDITPLPVSTYRLQITADFTLFHAAELVDYVSSLGVDWVYISPILRSADGSDHGYDVVDNSIIDPARGGAEGLAALSDACHSAGLGLLVDIVPNHLGVADATQNAWWWDVLEKGRDSRYAEAFDIDWDFGGGKLRIPVLGDGPTALDDLTIVGDELHYFENRYPIAPGTADDGASPAEVHDRQNYELINWRRADSELNYRRFFAVNTLAGVRVEVPWVFEESHAEILRWIREGLADGLRVDHPDGLADPGGYLDTLAAATGGTYVLVEKILEGDERLPAFWAAAGTTGYDALADIDRVLVDRFGRKRLDAIDTALRERVQPVEWKTLIHGTKRGIADGILNSEVQRLAREYHATRPRDEKDLVPDAVAELLACFPVYRSYLPSGAEHLEEAAELARRHRPELAATIDEILPVLLDPAEPMAVRFQQTSGMVMAKGVEDTAFYRYSRLGSLTEVGADPEEFSIGVPEFHSRQADRQATLPGSMTTLSTHDTKRGEDTRTRITVLSEVPDRWETVLGTLRELAPLGDGPLENLLWEATIGAWPVSAERLHNYAEKASREAGNSTNWLDPDEEFEKRMHAVIDAAFDDSRVTTVIEDFVAEIAQAGWSNSLSAKLIQLTAPGVPDVYQGSELWETSLVDPDNRRPVDYDIRRLYLAAVDAGAHPEIDETGAAKLLVTANALRLRRDRPELFTRYAPLEAMGEKSAHAIIFDRGGAVTIATRLPVGLAASGGWDDASVMLPGHELVDVISGRRYPGGNLPLADLLHKYPVALLAPVIEG
ncbi:(1-_4)-alpha-D-glucan 1-alpha-D-glucosylmutase [Conyzicola lurida]|uniref:(1->4)-alpha-D-glucan 1-alpha-D-glucosylmutase n=1 Tax=Conyzicola lurida TaxID=1172621 RepID=A0A841APZ6_9MICO|nr:malto-oligosyltrehalose synthase [Conyzicola lurida]MBB5843663.1 (1->4)-alpha-D-glucan 1-alpha-D-glucosylmutase [Conyzicola lurida]